MRPYSTSRGRRRGTITVVVISFLAIFLVLGLTFAFYAQAEADNARVYRDSTNGGHTGVQPFVRTSAGVDEPPEPDAIMNSALANLLYGPQDDLSGAFNAIREWDLARTIYGRNPMAQMWNPADQANWPTQAFNGYGRVPMSVIRAGDPTLPAQAANMINFAWVPTLPGLPALYFSDNNRAHNPMNGPVVGPYNPPPNPPTPPATTNDRYWARNANYTFPDENNLPLGVVDPSTGLVLMPSFHRPWLFMDGGVPVPANDPWGLAWPGNPYQNAAAPIGNVVPHANWSATARPYGRLMLLRPRPEDHVWNGTTEFPYPQATVINDRVYFADVENLEGKAIGRQLDSHWLDLDLSVRTWRGKNYKPLVAFLVLDLDSRVNLNTTGNFIAPGQPNSSNQGIGPWEVNPARVMLNDNVGASSLALGTSAATDLHARFGYTFNPPNPDLGPVPLKQFGAYQNDFVTPQTNMPAPGSGAHWHSGVDYNGRNGTRQYSYRMAPGEFGGRYTNFVWGPAYVGLPFDPVNAPHPPPDSRYDNGIVVPGPAGSPPVYDERSHHLSLYNPYLLKSNAWVGLGQLPAGTNIPNRTFGVAEMRHLNAKFNYGDYMNSGSDVARLAPNSLGRSIFPPGTPNSRFLTTVISNELDNPGATPWLGGPGGYNLAAGGAPQKGQPGPAPSGPPVGLDPTNPAGPDADYDSSFRAKLGHLIGAMDVNRKLTDYRLWTARPFGAMPAPTPPFNQPNIGNVAQAVADRQQLAADILLRLRLATGRITAPSVPTANDPTDRLLAQLAVNIVDFIDNDDCITPFKWTSATGGGADDLTNTDPNNANYKPLVQQNYVFGFERPRLVINETYTRFENDPTDTFPGNKAEKNFWMRTWVEMHNPVTPASPAEQFSGSEGYYQDPSQAAGWNPDDQLHGGYRTTVAENSGGTQSSVYRVLVTKIRQAVVANPDPMGMRDPNNVAGYPSTPLEPVVWFANVAGTQTVRHQQAAPLGQVVEHNVDLTGMGPPYGWTGANKNRSFFVVGPEADQTGWQPGMQGNTAAQIQNGGQQDQAELTSASLQWEIQRDPMMGDYTPPAMVGELGKVTWAPGFVLQRLACPAQPPGPTNPYVTIDYWDNDPVTVGNRLKYDMDGNGTGMEPPWEQTYAWGRRQPYDAVMMFQGQAPNGQQATALYRQQPNGVAQNPNHTFWQHNGQAQQRQQNDNWTNLGTTLEQPFRPLAHYDRVVINPTELFHVVAVRPHEFSQLFHGPPGAQPARDGLTTAAPSAWLFEFAADWLDHGVTNGPGGRLHRALGLVRTGTHIQGLGRGGRVPGKININTIFSQQVFDAVCDALLANTRTGPNRFNQDDVNAAWNALLASRHQTPGQFSVTDRPFVGNLTAIGDVGAAGNTVPYGRERTVARPNMLWPENA